MDLTEKYPALTNVIGYLHQDWKDDYDWGEIGIHYHPVIRFFKTHNPIDWAEQATRELREFIDLNLDEKHLEDALYHHFVLGTMPSYWGFSFREWLEDVLKILEEPMEQTKKHFIPEFLG